MAGQTITLHLPDELYNRLKQDAEQRNRTLEEELLHVLAYALPQDTQTLPADTAAELEALEVLNDAAVWRAARSHLSPRDSQRLEALHRKQQSGSLSMAESDEIASLTRHYDHTLVLRARAASILADRGHDV